jgi:predicted kinase
MPDHPPAMKLNVDRTGAQHTAPIQSSMIPAGIAGFGRQTVNFHLSAASILWPHNTLVSSLNKPNALFILGHAGTGKSFLTRHFVQRQQEQGRAWCVLDKDVVSESWSGPFLEALGAEPNDRDSPLFKDQVRDLEYASTLRIARDQLELGLNVAFPGPWSREQASGSLFSTQQLCLPSETQLRHVWLELPIQIRKDRIVERGDPRDAWKLANWEHYVDALKRPEAVQDGRVPVLDASLPLAGQLEALEALLP